MLFNKISFEADYYQNERSDVLYIDYQHPSVAGAPIPYENIGQLSDSGFDMKLGYATNHTGFNWFADFVFSYYNNVINEMGEAQNGQELEHLNRTGNSVSAIYGYETDGFFESEADIQSSPEQTFGTPRVGDLKYVDLNNDNLIDSRDITVIGNYLGNMDMGMRLGFAWKNLDVETFIQGQFNRDINLAGNPLAQPFIHGNAVNEIAEEDDFPTLSLSNMNNYQSSSFWVRNGDFVKIRNLELGYSIPEKNLSRMNIAQLRFFVRGVNVLTFSNWKYTDPEFTNIGYPPVKSYLLGINVNF